MGDLARATQNAAHDAQRAANSPPDPAHCASDGPARKPAADSTVPSRRRAMSNARARKGGGGGGGNEGGCYLEGRAVL